jgi:hypothetical protein
MSQNKTETSNVDDDEYLNNNEEPVEMISEMSPVQVKMTHEIAEDMTKRRMSFRKIASRLRFRKRL